ncbi:MAG: hypothetical protein ACXIUB_03320 [Wenzhouxiangella sp.]
MTTNLIISTTVLLVLFLLAAFLMKDRFQPTQAFGQRWLNALLVAGAAIAVYFPVALVKEIALFVTVNGELINTGQMAVTHFVFSTFTVLVLLPLLVLIIGPLCLAGMAYNKPAPGQPNLQN